MKIFKKILIFIITIFIVFSSIYIFPLNKLLTISTNQDNFYMYGNPFSQKYSHIMAANIDTEYKGDAVSMLVQSGNFTNKQRNMFYTILMYLGIFIHILLIAGSICIIKATKKEFFGKCLLVSSILSTIFLFFVIYSFYLSVYNFS